MRKEAQAENIAQKVRHYLITTMRKTSQEASDEEFYRAFCAALREEVMVNWTASAHTFNKKGVRKLYYLSMEYMPGRLFGNNITNISAIDLVKNVLTLLNRDFTTISDMEPDIGIGNGGLGRLASCFLDSLATLQYPAMGYGLRYQCGVFRQKLFCGQQVECPDRWLRTQNPWEIRQDSDAVFVHFGGHTVAYDCGLEKEILNLKDYERVRVLPYDLPIIGYLQDSHFSVVPLRLWSTKESPRNFHLQHYNAGNIGRASENTSLTNVLYPNDNHDTGKRIRLKQEFLLVSASLKDIINQYKKIYSDVNSFADTIRIQINDTHPALAIPELMHLLIKEYRISFNHAWEITSTCCSFTNHTVLKEAIEEWNTQHIEELLPIHYSIIQKLNFDFTSAIRKKFPSDEEKVRRMSIIENNKVRMANLAIHGSHKVNGVARLHSEILKKDLFKDFNDMYPEKFVNVTNGVTQRRWLLHCNPLLVEFLEKRIGKGWITNFEEIKSIAQYADDPKSQQEFLEIKKKNKERLLKMIEKDMGQKHDFHKSSVEQNLLGPNALFDVQIKRIHEYKRQLMNALHLLMLYFEIKQNPDSHRIQRLAIFGGKAAPGYQLAKNIIRMIYCLSRKINLDPVVGKKLKIHFIENYNVSRAEIIIPGTDLSEQISTAGMEASGTGNMKFAMNGALTIATDDGANVEMRENIGDKWWPFMFGASSDENESMRKNQSYNPQDIYAKESKIAEALNALKDRSLVENDVEHEALVSIYNSLVETPHSDHFFVLNDLMAYYEKQRQVESLYLNPNKWAEFAIQNMAGMGQFSTDVSMENYVKKIWGLKKCPPDQKELEAISKEFSEHNRWKM